MGTGTPAVAARRPGTAITAIPTDRHILMARSIDHITVIPAFMVHGCGAGVVGVGAGGGVGRNPRDRAVRLR
jgi:hypothetical protein